MQSKPIITTQEIWAAGAPSADKTKPTLAKISTGWTFGEKPPHNEFNWFFEITTEMFVHLQENGVANWSNDITYTESGMVWYESEIWRSIISNNTNHTPAAGSLWWDVFDASIPQLATPLLSGNNTGAEETEVEITITNYDSGSNYTIVVGGGSYSRVNDIITWTLPSVGADTIYAMSVYSTKVGYTTSMTATHNTTVTNVFLTPDQTLLYNSGNMDEFTDLVNTEISSLDAVEMDSTNVQNNNYTSTTSIIYLDNKMVDVQVGETITTDNESFVVQAVDNDGNVTFMDKVTTVSAGEHHTMIIKDGEVWGTGGNSHGQLGNSSSIDVNTFTRESQNITNAEQISCGDYFTMILTTDGQVYGTGNNTNGQLGTTAGDKSIFTRETQDITNASRIECGERFTLIIKDGGVYGTGYNAEGQLGLDDTDDRSDFTRESRNFTDVEQISSSRTHSALLKNGEVYSTGYNAEGQLGNNDTISESTFTRESQEFTDVDYIGGGDDHTMIIKNGGELWGTGVNTLGELGDDTSDNKSTFTRESQDFTDVDRVDGGDLHTMIIRDGRVWCSGKGNSGVLGDGTENTRYTFTRESQEFTNVVQVAGGAVHSSFITADGQVWSTGTNTQGELGDGTSDNKSIFTRESRNISDAGTGEVGGNYYIKYWVTPVSILSQIPVTAYLNTHRARSNDVIQDPGDNDWIGFSGAETNEDLNDVINSNWASGTSIIYLDNSRVEARVGETYCSELGETFTVETVNNDGTKDSIDDVKFVACGSYHTMVIRNGQVWGAGRNSYGQLGTNDTSNYSTFTRDSQNITDATEIACGDYFTMIIKSDGQVWGTGNNGSGELGLDHTNDISAFTRENENIINADRIECGKNHSLILKNGGLWATGSNIYGQLGNSTTVNESTFTQESLGFGVGEEIAAGLRHSCVMKNGGIFSTGRNNEGQLGLDHTNDVLVFTKESQDFTDVDHIGSGDNHTMIIKNGGELWCTGVNTLGELGDGTSVNKSIFTRESQHLANVAQVDGGDLHTMIITTDGQVWGCGKNYDGNLGDETQDTKYVLTRESQDFTDAEQIACGYGLSVIIRNGQVWGTGENGSGQLGTNYTTEMSIFTREYQNIIDAGPFTPYLKYWVNPVENLQAVPFKAYPLVNITLKTTEEDVDLIPDNIDLNSTVGGTDMIDSDWASTTTSVYIDNEFFNVKVGDTYVSDTGEPFSVEVVNNDGTVANIDSVNVLACGYRHTMVIRNNGEVWGTGDNIVGQLGTTAGDKSVFTRETENIEDAEMIACGWTFSMIIRNSGEVWGTGQNTSGELGILGEKSVFTRETENIEDAEQISCGYKHSMIIRNNGEIWGTGDNDHGQLGTNDQDDRTKYTKVSENIYNVDKILCAYKRTMIIRNNGEVWGAGYNNNDQLGTIPGDKSVFTRETEDIEDAEMIACGYSHTMIIRNGQVWGTGSNDYGQLGTTAGDKSVFTRATEDIEDAEMIACGYYNHTLIIRNNGEIWGTGENNYGQLGTTAGDKSVFTRETEDIEDANTISCGLYHTMIIRNNGEVWGTGSNDENQLGTTAGDKSVFTRETEDIDDAKASSGTYLKYWITPSKTLAVTPSEVYTYTPSIINQEFEDELITSTRSFKTIVHLPDNAKLNTFSGTLEKS